MLPSNDVRLDIPALRLYGPVLFTYLQQQLDRGHETARDEVGAAAWNYQAVDCHEFLHERIKPF